MENSKKADPSVDLMWAAFAAACPAKAQVGMSGFWHFCDEEFDANECGQLVLDGIKRATAGSKWGYDKGLEPHPEIGDLSVITNWDGVALCIIETTQLDEIPFKDITADHAKIEGEGDKSLAYWRKVHLAFYTRQMAPFGEKPDENLVVVFEQFHVVWPK